MTSIGAPIRIPSPSSGPSSTARPFLTASAHSRTPGRSAPPSSPDTTPSAATPGSACSPRPTSTPDGHRRSPRPAPSPSTPPTRPIPNASSAGRPRRRWCRLPSGSTRRRQRRRRLSNLHHRVSHWACQFRRGALLSRQFRRRSEALAPVSLRTYPLAGALTLLLAACTAIPGASQSSTASDSPVPAPVDQLAVSDANLDLAVKFNSAIVAPGATVKATVLVTNRGSGPVVYQSSGCGMPATLVLMVPVPSESGGVAQNGPAGAFKQYILSQGFGQRGLPALSPVPQSFGAACDKAPNDATIVSGGTVTGASTWVADVVPDLPAPAGLISAVATLNYGPLPGPSLPDQPAASSTAAGGGLRPPLPMWIEQYHQLSVTGSLEIAGTAKTPSAMSAAQAVDAALNVVPFSTWVMSQPASSWANANLYLDTRGWHVELFVQPRAFAMVLLDPVTGSVRSTTICAAPTCDQ